MFSKFFPILSKMVYIFQDFVSTNINPECIHTLYPPLQYANSNENIVMNITPFNNNVTECLP